MQSRNLLPIFVVLLSFGLFFLQHLATQPPSVKAADAPQDQFSAARAYKVLEVLLKENKPHPVGSQMNQVVKNRIKNELDKLAIEYEEQKTWACASRFGSCAEVDNLIAIIPGKTDAPYLALMAHYDSVPMSPGAGDDGSGVVAIIETARALKLEAPFQHPIALIFTDAEEIGLVGAEAFFEQHPLAKKVGIVLNVEGSGSSGSSMVLRTSKNNELLMKSYSAENVEPYGYSFVKEIFKRMPNDTDFSVVERAQISGIDFVFAGERNHYHTPNDNLENIDLRTIQHHGENILPLSRELASVEWNEMGDEYVYAGEVYGLWTQWRSSNSIIILLVSLLLLLAALAKSNASLKGIALGVVFSPLTVVITVLSGALGFYLLSITSGTIISWPGIDWPYRLLLLGATGIGLLTATMLNKRFVDQIDMIFGAWFFWFLIAFATSIYLPDAANNFVLPIMGASLLIVLSNFIKEKYRVPFLSSVLVMTIPFTLGLLFSLEQSQGYKLVWALLPFIGLFALIITPFLYDVNKKFSFGLLFIVAGVSILMASNTHLYTEDRPQHVNILFYEDLDSGQAHVELAGDYKAIFSEPFIEPISSYVAAEQPQSLLPFNKEIISTNWAKTDSSGWAGPSLMSYAKSDSDKTVSLKLKSNRSASRLVLLLAENSGLASYALGELEVKPILSKWGLYKGYYAIYLNGIYDKVVDLRLTFKTADATTQGYLMDISTQLPPSVNDLFNDRTGIFSPVHRGDQSVLVKRIEF